MRLERGQVGSDETNVFFENKQKSISPFKETVFDGVKYIAPSWDQMGEMTFQLAKQILESGEKYDQVVTLAKGGWTWTRTLVDYLAMDDIASFRIRFYNGIGQTMKKPEIVQPLSVPINGKKILFFDEVIDSGETTKKAEEYLLASGALLVDTATLCYKPRSIITPNYYAFQTDAWVMFPHEIRESVENAGRAWVEKGITLDEVKARFHEIGLPDHQVLYFLPNNHGV